MYRSLIAILILFLVYKCAGAETVTAKSWLVADENGKMIEGSNTSEVRSIASITKLLTAMIVLDANQDLDEGIKTTRYKSTISRHMLMDMALVRSDNTAAVLLCQHYPTGYNGCIQAMNNKAQSLGMTNTHFDDPTGLDKHNVSTADDLLKLVQAAGVYPLIVEAGNKDAVTFQTKKKQSISFRNTNPMVGRGHGILVSKTGFINRAGGCIVMTLLTINGLRTVILLGSKNTHTRISEATFLSMK